MPFFVPAHCNGDPRILPLAGITTVGCHHITSVSISLRLLVIYDIVHPSTQIKHSGGLPKADVQMVSLTRLLSFYQRRDHAECPCDPRRRIRH